MRWLAAAFVLLAALGGNLAQRRLSDHRGFFLVAQEDRFDPRQFARRPRHTTLVILDGLRADFAHTSRWYQRLAAAGVCWDLDVDKPTVSMPGYASISTGVEADRTGVRSNGREHDAVGAESIWQVAREAGLSVGVYSHLEWWWSLFPALQGERAYVLDVDLFARAAEEPADLRLVHPVGVDEAAHAHGVRSPEHAAAVARVDAELNRYLDGVDLAQDLVLVTADHGHAERGGHGGMQPEVRRVATCAAGRGVKRGPPPAHPRLRHIAVYLAVRLGLPFPRHALGDDPDAPGWAQLDAPEAYVAERRATWAGFTYRAPYEREARAQRMRAVPTLLGVAAIVIFLALRRGLSGRALLAHLGWLVGVVGGYLVVYLAVRGSLDGTSIRNRLNWIEVMGLTSSLYAALVALANHWIWRDRRRVVVDGLAAATLCLLLDLAHAVTYGWPMGFPVPRVELMFWPFVSASFLLGQGLVALVWSFRYKVES